MKTGLYVLVVSLGLSLPCAAQAPAAPPRLTWEAVWAHVEQHHPDLAVSRATLEGAKGALTQARLRPNPSLELSSEGYAPGRSQSPSFVNNQEIAIRGEWEIETAGKRRHRTTVANAGVDAAHASLDAVIRRVRLDAVDTYLDVVLTAAYERTARALLANVDRTLEINTERFANGELPGLELRRLALERQRFADDLLSAELDRRNAQVRLLAVMGASALDTTVDVALDVDDLATVPATENGARATSLERPAWLVAQALTTQAKATLRLEQAHTRPNLVVGGGWIRDFGSNGLLLSAGIPLPLFNRQQGTLVQAAAAVSEAEARAAAVALELRIESQVAANTESVAARRLVAIEREYVPRATETRNIVIASYREGAASLIDYLDTERQWRETLRARSSARVEWLRARCHLAAVQTTFVLPLDLK